MELFWTLIKVTSHNLWISQMIHYDDGYLEVVALKPLQMKPYVMPQKIIASCDNRLHNN